MVSRSFWMQASVERVRVADGSSPNEEQANLGSIIPVAEQSAGKSSL